MEPAAKLAVTPEGIACGTMARNCPSPVDDVPTCVPPEVCKVKVSAPVLVMVRTPASEPVESEGAEPPYFVVKTPLLPVEKPFAVAVNTADAALDTVHGNQLLLPR